MTIAENTIWLELKEKKFNGIKFRRQFSIGPYIADFYSPKMKLVIEIDGSSHSEIDAIEYDEVRNKYIESLGITIIRFKNYDVMNNMETVLDILKQKIQSLPPYQGGTEGGYDNRF